MYSTLQTKIGRSKLWLCLSIFVGLSVFANAQDTTPPMLSDCPADMSYQCEGDVPPAPSITAMDDEDGSVSVQFFETDLSDPQSSICDLTTPGTSADGDLYWSVFLPNLPAGITSNFVWDASGPQMFLSGDEMLVTGTVVNLDNPSHKFFIHFAADSKVDYNGWIGQLTTMNPIIPRRYKDTEGHAAAGGNLWTTWDYFEVDAANAYMVGLDGLAGSVLSLSHAPVNYLFGVQLGDAANDKTPGYGMASWFNVTGTILGNSYSGQGDISTLADCNNPSTQCASSILRQWTAFDAAGNLVECEQLITIADTTAPTFSSMPADATVECDNIPAAAVLTAIDNCSGSQPVSFSESTVGSGCEYTIIRDWSSTDACGNVAMHQQILTVVDTTAPEFIANTIPADVTVECGNVPPAGDPNTTDNCQSPVSITMTETEAGDSCNGTVTRTWTINDGCGNTNAVTQVITVVDTTAPEFVASTIPADITVECGNVPDAVLPTATDNCQSPVAVTMNETSAGDDCELIITRTFVINDGCGNTNAVSQVITVVDTTAPWFIPSTVPADITIECGTAIPFADPNTIDNCQSPVSITVALTEVAGDCPAEKVITRTWTINDGCGNSTSTSQNITVVDTTAPSIVAMADTQIECGADLPAPSATATDDCSAVTWTSSDSFAPGCGNTGVYTRTYVATDACGNTATDVQTITVVDTTPPSISAAADMTIECGNDVPAPAATAADTCGDASWTVAIATTPGCGNTYTEVRTYTATDDCNNTATAMQTITVVDTTIPVFGDIEPFLTVECDDIPDAADVPATDNCGTAVVTVVDSGFSGGCEGAIQRVYTATDLCGNTNTYTQVVNIVDNTNPVIIPAADMTVECNTPVPAPAATATDNCGNATWTVAIATTPGCGNTYTEVRTYTATDDCNNTATATQTITVVDNVAPSIVAAADTQVECGADLPAPSATASDLCGNATWTVAIATTPGCGNTYTEVRTYTATDDCGNTATDVQTITVVDTTAPSISAAADMTIECGDDVPAPAATAADTCGDASWTVAIATTPGCGNTYTEVRTYTATDDCNNTATAMQTITVVDTTIPVFGDIEPFLTVECDDIPDAADVPATDNCGTAVVTVVDSGFSGGCEGAIQRVYTATDECGNTNTYTQIVNVVDNTNPVLSSMPADMTVECDNIPAIVVLTATDNCGNATVASSEVVNGSGCEYTIVRTWTATDDCNNTAVHTQTVTVVDTTMPEFIPSTVPGDITIECGTPIPFADPNTTDNCSSLVSISVSMSEVPGDCDAEKVITRTWTINDGCDNTNSVSQVITVVDTTAPQFIPSTVPADVTAECDAIPAVEYPNSTDNCSSVVAIVLNETETGDDCNKVISREFVITDECGNTNSVTQTITVVDTTIPQFIPSTVPASVTVECGNIPGVVYPNTTDNCQSPVGITLNETQVGDDCEMVITRTFVINDLCGNTNSVTQTITVVDTTAPLFIPSTVPADVTVECGNIPAVVYPNSTDNCQSPVAISLNETEVGDGCELIISRMFVINDGCGNTNSVTQTITVVDTTAPEFIASTVPADVTIECGTAIPFADPNTTDNCQSPVSISVVVSEVAGDCPAEMVITRTWTINDGCDNTNSVSQVITVVDTTAPSIVAMADTQIECGADLPVPSATATDACSTVTWTSSDSFAPACGNTGVYTRTYVATDACGNTATDVQTITVVDTTAPSISAAADMTIECGNDVPAPAATAADTCGDASWTVAIATTPGCGNTYTEVRTYTATDDCNNTATAMQTITVVDTTIPVFGDIEPFLTVECDDIPDAADVPATDNCGTAVVTVVDSGFSGGCEGAIQRVYTATDLCGNTNTYTQVVNIVDNTNPVIIPAADMTVECNTPVPAPAATATDNCGNATWTVAIATTPGCGNTYTEVRTYTATDDCNNTATATQTITVVDNVAPSIVAAADTQVECGADLPVPSATASDLCGNATWTVAAEVTPTCGETFIMVRTYTATDDCGNTATDVQTITVVDTTAPSISAAADMTIECGNDVPAPAATAADTCGDASWTVAIATTPGCGNTYTEVRTYTATDDCNNTATAMQTITVVDTTIPVFGDIEPFLTVECDDIPDAADVPATDNCGTAVVTVVDSGFSGGCEGAIQRVYTATDLCGNTNTYTQVVNIVDNTNPVIIPAADMTVECNTPVPAPAATATDNCGNATWTVAIATTPGCGNTYTEVRTYTATDDCNNTATATQTITVVDNVAPSIVAAADTQVECGADLPAPSATASDLCGNATWTVAAEVTPTCGETFIMVRTYTATDDCGNTATDVQTITVVDTTPPSISAAADMTIECGNDIPAPAATTADTCGNADWTVAIATTPGCGNTYTEVRTYTATDDCNNTATATQTITVVDNTPPVLGAIEAFLTVECDMIPLASDIPATDNCGTAVVTVLDAGFSGGCEGAIQRTYTATDLCGNTIQFTQVINVIDVTPPVLDAAPADMTIECPETYTIAVLSATDNCGDADVTSNAVVTPGSCDGESTVVITWTAIDDCNNSSTVSQTVTIEDNTAPVFENAPANMTVDCQQVPAPAAVTAFDLCSSASVAMTETSTTGCPYSITRVFTASDDCGNTAVHTQVITVVDTTMPVLIGTPADMTVECDAIPGAITVTATDNCDSDVPVSMTEMTVGAGCQYAIERTYTATDDCGNSTVYTQTLTVVDTTSPEFIASTVPADVTVECDAIPTPADPNTTDNCSAAVSSVLTQSEVAGSCDGEKVITRTWTINDGCGNTNSVSQTITVIDTTAPEFTSTPVDETYTCGDVIPDAPVLTADDNCSQNVTITMNEETEGNTNPYLDCTLTTEAPGASNSDQNTWSMFIQASGSAVKEYFVLDGNGATFAETPIGGGMFEGHITGTLVNPDNASEAFMIDVYLIMKTDHAGWTSQLTLGNPSVPRLPKDFFGISTPGDELTWDYWLIDSSRSQLVGINDYAGDILSVSHAPVNHLFAFQVGMNANSYSPGFGLGGWFFYNGTIDGAPAGGQGDFAFNADCPPCEYTVTRTWTATDDCGNSTMTSQLITVNAPTPEVQGEDVDMLVQQGEEYGFVSAYPNPTGNIATLVYTVPTDTDVVIEVLNSNSKSINTIFNGAAVSGVDNYAQFDGSNFDNGIYVVKLTTSTGVFYQKVMLNK